MKKEVSIPVLNKLKTKEVRTKCICPLCNITHYCYIYWTGKGIPRKFCRACGRFAKTVADRNEALNITKVAKQKAAAK